MDIDFKNLDADISKVIKELAEGLSVYVNLKTDFGFKRVFGVKEVMLSFLNTVLKIEGGIIDLVYVNTEILGLTKDDRKSIFDLICVTGNGEHIVVEMQTMRQTYYKDRTVFYAASLIHQQGIKGKIKDPITGKDISWDYKLPPVYVINIIDFCLDETQNIQNPNEKYASYIQLMDVDAKETFYDKLTLVYIELARFSKELKDVKTFLEQWIYIIKHLHELKTLPEELKIEVVDTIFEIAKIAKMSKDEVFIYLKSVNDMGLVQEEIRKKDNTIAALQSERAALQNENAELRRMLGINQKHMQYE